MDADRDQGGQISANNARIFLLIVSALGSKLSSSESISFGALLAAADLTNLVRLTEPGMLPKDSSPPSLKLLRRNFKNMQFFQLT